MPRPFKNHILAGLVCLTATLDLSAAPAGIPPIGVGLYGTNGQHPSAEKLAQRPDARIVAAARVADGVVPAGVRSYTTLEELIADPRVQLVSLCSPRRADQARDAIRCLEAGKHVYAEKPCALTERELDAILDAARRAGREFHERAGTAFTPGYAAMRKLVRAGGIGDVIQVFAQKSYKYDKTRPQDEAIDGGMFLQVGIHATRMIEHVGGVRMKSLAGWETKFGSPEPGDNKMAGAAQIELENGGIATIIVNYLNPENAALPHANETLRIFGTKGYVESVDGGARTRLVTAEKVIESIDTKDSGAGDYFDFVAAHLARSAPLPLTLEEELHPLRMLLRAKEQMRAAGRRN